MVVVAGSMVGGGVSDAIRSVVVSGSDEEE
jgi:hypothetical protein